MVAEMSMPSAGTPFRKQLWGWLSYAFASEVFVIVSLTLFLPICLEQFARDNGFLLPDRTEPCSSSAAGALAENRCVVKLGWAWIDTASFSLYVYSMSVALQALTVISMGGVANHPPHRKKLLLSFAVLGASATVLFLPLSSSSPIWPLSGLLAICGNVGFGASVVAMNSYLPSLAKASPDVQLVLSDLQDERTSEEAMMAPQENDNSVLSLEEPLIYRPSTHSTSSLGKKYEAELSKATSRISSHGIAIGYGAGIVLLLLTLIPVTLMHGSTFSLRLAIGLSGVWWALFTLPAAVWLPGAVPALAKPDDLSLDVPVSDFEDKQWSTMKEIIAAWKRLGGMLYWKEVKKLRHTFAYLAAWFLLSDGFATITSTAILFAKTSLNMQASQLILIGAITPTCGILGALIWPHIQKSFGWSNLKVITILVAMVSAIPAYGCLGFLPIFRGRSSFGGLTTQGEMFALTVYFGFVFGPFQSYARAMYAELIPPGEEARWYGLFSITDKSSSFIGPLIVGLIADSTGNIRYAFFFLVFMIWLALPILMSVDVERGRRDARDYVYPSSSIVS